MMCPRCSVAEISPLTDACELCGFAPDGSVAVAVPRADATDELVHRELAHQLQIDFLIGQGPASAVYLAREKDSDRLVILKAMPRLPHHPSDADARFRQAVSVVQSLDHAHLVPILRFGTTDSLFWYSMEPVRGRPLREILRARGPMELKTCLRICAQIASALDYAHRRAVIHGDLKPENVLIDHDGWARVCDAMIPRELQPRPVRTSGPRPTRVSKAPTRATGKTPAPDPAARPAYVAPEDYAEGFRSAASDQYALGVLVHECLTGYPPGAGLPPGAPPTPLGTVRPDLPACVTFGVQRAMSDRPADRFPTVLDFVTMLESGAVPQADARPSGKASQVLLVDDEWEPPPVPPLRRAMRLTAAAAVLLAVGGAIALLVPRLQNAAQRQSAPPASTTVAPTDSAAPGTDSTPAATDAPATPSDAPAERRSPAISLRPRAAASRSTSRNARNARRDARQPAPATARPQPSSPPAVGGPAGRLFVNATPWAQVFVDGQSVGNTPKANFELTAGTHRLRVIRDGYEPFERTITIASGETVRLTDIVLVERRP